MSFTPEESETIRRLIGSQPASRQNAEEADRKRPKFDGTFNLGHILTIVTMIGGLALMWANGRVSQADHEIRIVSLERSQVEMRTSIVKMAETADQAMRNQDKISIALDYLVKERPPKPR